MGHRRLGRLLVTGGTGFLGRHVVGEAVSDGREVVAPSSRSLDLRDRDAVLALVRDRRPDAIVHTAYRVGDRASIVGAVGNVAEAAAAVGARLVHVSTDALFAGRPEPYREDDPPTPVTDYGRDKADAERVVADRCGDHVIVRTSLLIGSRELSSHERAVHDAISGASTTRFFTDEVRCPVVVDDLATALVDLTERDAFRGLLHLAGPTPVSRADLAVSIAGRHGWDVGRLRFSTIAEAGLVRPAHVVLDSTLAASHGHTVRSPWD